MLFASQFPAIQSINSAQKSKTNEIPLQFNTIYCIEQQQNNAIQYFATYCNVILQLFDSLETMP